MARAARKMRDRTCAGCAKVEMVDFYCKSIRCRVCAGKYTANVKAERGNSYRGGSFPVRKPDPSRTLTLQCGGCKGLFTRYAGNTKNPENSYCSRACITVAKSVDRVCKCCGKGFVTQVGRLSGKTNSSANFCSRPCYETWLCSTERTRTRGVRWYKVSAEQRKRTPFCAICGRHHARLEVHHIVPYRLTADNSPNNLIVLCAKHHKVVECATADMLSLGLGYEVVAQIMGARLRYRQSLTIYRLLKVANERARQIA